jgi:argininosuccinate lyase
MEGMVRDLTMNTERMRAAAAAGYATATDLADFLVRVLGMAFREAHHATGKIVALAEAKGKRLDELSLEDFKSIEPAITADVFSVLTVEASVASRLSYGGTAPDNVKRQAALWRDRLSKE